MDVTLTLPDEITREQVAAAIKALGIPDDTRVTSVHMDVRVVDIRGMAGDVEFTHRYFLMS